MKSLKQLLNLIETLAEVAIDLIKVPFGFPFERNFHDDFNLDYFPRQTSGAKPPKIFGIDDGFSLSNPSAVGAIQCAKCGIKGKITVDGEFAFSIKEGVTKGEISFVNPKSLTISAIAGITVRGQLSEDLKKITKQLKALPLSPLAIPGIFTIGPQVSISAAATLDITGRLELLMGGELTIGDGTARASLVDSSRNELTGFHPTFKPVFKATAGEIGVTMDFGLPVALEAGLDVLSGKFKKTVGIVNTPSLYVNGKAASGGGAACEGISLTVGAKNKIHIGAFGLVEYTLHELQVYESQLLCIKSVLSFSLPRRQRDSRLTEYKIRENGIAGSKRAGGDAAESVAEHFGGKDKLSTNKKPQIENLHSSLKSGTNMEGFRLLMDVKETSILVSGSDGGVYFADKKENYDLSAPWGTVDTKSNIMTFDIFGRLLNFDYTHLRYSQGLVAPLFVNTPEKMPLDKRGSENLPYSRYAA